MSELYEDLLQDSSESFEDGNYFIVTITELELSTAYPLQFKWKYKDGTFGKDWSAVKVITTESKTIPNTPQFLSGNVTGGAGSLTIEWNGKDSGGVNNLINIDRVEVWISEPPFDSTKPVYSSKTKFKTQLQAPAGSYTVALYAVTVNGQYSAVSSAFTVNVTSIAAPVTPPTLPTGLSVATAPFAVSVNWGGSYSANNFDGFKSIDIHVRGSDVGATATSGFSTTTQVATLNVNSTTNRQNVGLDNLRQALSLASNDAAYTAPMFFYYIARNQNDALYSVSGTPTYTRINSTTVNPTQANFIDLANGVISIENLVAGNGNFSSWLRTGTAGGTRIELSAVNDFSNSGNIVQKGLVAYSSGSTEIFNLDIDAGTLIINGSGTFTGNLSIGSSNSIFKAEPATGIWLGNASYGSAPFSVSVNGAIKAESGNIAGWQLNPTFLQNTSGTFKISSTNSDPQIQVGSDAGGHVRISAGNGIAHYSSGTTLSGRFTLSPTGTSTISGWTIGTNTISKGSTIIDGSGTNGYIQIGSNTSFFKVSSDGIQLGNETFGSAPFRVNPAGALIATNATITGDITANSGSFTGSITSTTGTIGGWSIGQTTLTGGATSLNSNGNIIITSGTKTTTISNSASISLVDTSTGFLTGGALTVQSGSESAAFYATGLSFGVGSIFSNKFAAGIPLDALVISTTGPEINIGSIGTGIVIRLNGTTNSLSNTISTGTHDTSSTSFSIGSAITSTGAIISRRDDQIPVFAHRFRQGNPYTGATQYEVFRGILEATSRGSIFLSMTGSPALAVPSDYRLKENVRDYTESINVIKSKRLRIFNLKNDPTKTDTVGFIAHEFGEDNSELVIGSKDAVDDEGNPEYQSVAFTNLIPYLTGALKESILKIESLEARLDALEG